MRRRSPRLTRRSRALRIATGCPRCRKYLAEKVKALVLARIDFNIDLLSPCAVLLAFILSQKLTCFCDKDEAKEERRALRVSAWRMCTASHPRRFGEAHGLNGLIRVVFRLSFRILTIRIGELLQHLGKPTVTFIFRYRSLLVPFLGKIPFSFSGCEPKRSS